MWQVILAIALLGAASGSPRRREPRPPVPIPFQRRPGGLKIIKTEHRVQGVCVRRFTPAFDPPPWELHIAADEEGMEYFAFTFHPEFDCPRADIRAYCGREQPVDVSAKFDLFGNIEVARDPFFDGRWRYSHREQGRKHWFLIEVRGRGGDGRWLFEHKSLYSDVIDARPRLSHFAVGTSDPNVRLTPNEERLVAEMRWELGVLRQELNALSEKRNGAGAGVEGIAALMKRIEQIAAVAKDAHARIDALDGLDDDQRADLHEVINLEVSQATKRLQEALSDAMEARR